MLLLLQSKDKANVRGRKRKCVEPVVVMEETQEDQGGCLKCHKDVDYEQVWEGDTTADI